MDADNLEGRYFPAGTIVHMNGVPVALVTGVNLETHPVNWRIIEEQAFAGQVSRERAPLNTP